VPSKSLGQNFLTDASVADRIVREARLDASFGVLEIGPGTGALTPGLCAAAGRVVAVELDGRLIPALEAKLAGAGNAEIVQGDIMKIDIGGLVEEKFSGLRRVVCANLPYGITTPAITALLRSEAFESLTVMAQREVAARICAAPGSPDCGSFSIFCQYHAECAVLFDVPPDAFVPRPSVWSSVVRLVARRERAVPREGEKMFFRVSRAAFAQRRKTLVNALSASFGHRIEKSAISQAICALGYSPLIRGEVLGVSDFAEISAALSENMKSQEAASCGTE
jgi:16S rRNA (adenine1518-N6/adenine1519-N6)-dimethyltransferase